MEFSGQYLTYEEYRALGGTLTLTPFNLLEFEARRQIDIRTFNRVKELDSENIPQEVKMCMFQLINSLNGYMSSASENGGSKNIASENTDGYSVSYVSSTQISEVVKSKQTEIGDIVRTYLLGVIINDEHALYCGIDKC